MAEDANCIIAPQKFWQGFVDALRHDNAMPWADAKAVYDVMLTMKTDTAEGTVLAELLSYALPGTNMRYVTKGFPVFTQDPGQSLFRADYLTCDGAGKTLYFVEFRLPGQSVGWKRYDRYVSLLGKGTEKEGRLSGVHLCAMYERAANFDREGGPPKNRYYQTQWKELAAVLETLAAKQEEVKVELIYLLSEPFTLAERLAARGREDSALDLGERFHAVDLNRLAREFTGGSENTRCFLALWRTTHDLT